jgi:hypothetical protein
MRLRQILLAGTCLLALSTVSWAVPTQITVQGKLTDAGGVPLPAGAKTLTFRIFNAATLGTQIWPATGGEIQSITSSTDGLWVGLVGGVSPLTDPVFADSVRWLEINVNGTTLPRVRLVTGPYAFRVATVDGASGGTITSSLSIGSNNPAGLFTLAVGQTNSVFGDRSSVTGGSANSAFGLEAHVGGGLINGAFGDRSTIGGGGNNRTRGIFSVVGGGGGASAADSNSALGDWSFVGGGHKNIANGDSSIVVGGTRNTADGPGAIVIGGSENHARGAMSFVGGGGGMFADSNSASGQFSVAIGGNHAIASGDFSFVGGGYNERAIGDYALSGGGKSNWAQGDYSAVVGGESNSAQGGHSVVVGGTRNITSTDGPLGFIGGGDSNTVDASLSFVGGGQGNRVNASYSSLSGGYHNSVSAGYAVAIGGFGDTTGGEFGVTLGGSLNRVGSNATYSLTAGYRAKADSSGCFVWGDGTEADFASTHANQFLIRASGGVGIGTSSPDAPLHVFESSAGAVTANGASIAAFERNGSGYLSVLTPNADEGGVLFGQPSNAQAGGIVFNNAATPEGLQFRVKANTTKMVIDSGGQVGIGITTPGAPLHVRESAVPGVTASASSVAIFERNSTAFLSILGGYNSTKGILFGDSSNALGGEIFFDGTIDNGFEFRTGAASAAIQMVLDSSGHLGLGGLTAPANVLTLPNIASVEGRGLANAWSVYSSRRWKTNIKTIADPLDKIERLRGVTYDWKIGGQHDIGLVAEEVGQVVPEVVTYEKNGVDAQSVDYSRLVAVLIEGMKEQQGIIDSLRTRVTNLESRP